MDSKLIHHTWTDWDWSDSNWKLSPPPGGGHLVFTGASLTACLCNLPDSINLPQGKLVTTWFFEPVTSILFAHFRNQQTVPNSSFINCYFVEVTQFNIRLYRRENNVNTLIANFETTQYVGNLFTLTVTWWIFKEPYQPDKLRVRINRSAHGPAGPWEGEADDPENKWVGSPTNRCGLAGSVYYVEYPYHDETEIWLPTL